MLAKALRDLAKSYPTMFSIVGYDVGSDNHYFIQESLITSQDQLSQIMRQLRAGASLGVMVNRKKK